MAVDVSERDGVVYLRVAAPAGIGPAAERLAWAIADACAAIDEREAPPVGVAIVGAGGAYCVLPPRSAAECDALGAAWAAATAAVGRLGPPTLAVIGGDAVGPAWELALACDLRIATDGARLGSPEVRWGRLPAAGGTQRLTRLAGPAVALRLLLLGEVLAAPEALGLGLVHRVGPAEGLEAAQEELLEALRAGAPIALGYAKEAVRQGLELPLAAGLRLEADLAALLQTTRDRAEGLAAFAARRAPRYEAR
ncbi:MAG TPA: enoyl-CoA hydratase-related protein [Chloroflexota bacterium]|nr:enoyl-CoA hydratase-related protein [Chloroflexota bacterium]